MGTYFILLYLISLALGYVLAFTEATLALGRSLSDTDSSTGYQDAITPPYFSKLAILVYIGAFAGIAYVWWQYGWPTGLVVTAGFFVITVVNKLLLLPKNESDHFRQIITRSMINRYADYVKSGDELRASAMVHLLNKLDIPADDLVARLRKPEHSTKLRSQALKPEVFPEENQEIHFNCPKCGSKYAANYSQAGKTGKCKKCGHVMTVPE